MVVDTDHNDIDDRLAIILVAYQMASANIERQKQNADSRCTLFLDSRTYESSSVTLWRTLRLAARLDRELGFFGFSVVPVISDRQRALDGIASYLRIPAESVNLDARAAGAGTMLMHAVQNLRSWFVRDAKVSIWLISGVCEQQVEDMELNVKAGIRFTLYEQAPLAWQSMELTPSQGLLQPKWSFPPADELEAEAGFGAEPSNIRTSERSYPETISVYMRMQRLIESTPASALKHVNPALARKDGFLPSAPGRPMLRVAGRPLTVLPGPVYEVKTALDPARASTAFASLLKASRANQPDTIYLELCQGLEDDAGVLRQNVSSVAKHGTFMADPILIVLAARPPTRFKTMTITRRLAVVKMPSAQSSL
eukprot:gnl/TRDRNA2_/TRDRNA2_110919_c1_seq1.p1 gnl/TRDRNA2_/TRDRNA2_110919_c1~~gnl/TRDRNA2_/TRDRNA2_110919_c1_seq1.p1  ORF type:complete len:416 (-),score=71.02 gnl/TRDRNA2_/TRDRNA2_110919_c1_seq1:37-1140(-)